MSDGHSDALGEGRGERRGGNQRQMVEHADQGHLPHDRGALSPASRSGYGQMIDVGGPPPPAALGARTGGIDIVEYWRAIMRRKTVIAAIMGVCLLLGALSAFTTTPVYTASTRIQIDRNVVRVVEGGNITPIEGADFDFMRTQYELLNSRALAERVASALNLGSEPDFGGAKNFSVLGLVSRMFSRAEAQPIDKKALERRAVRVLLSGRHVRPVAGSRLVDITFVDPSPSRAQRIAAAYAEAFIASNLDKRFQANSYAKTFLEDQVNQLKVRLEEAEKVLLDFAEKEQIIIVTEKASNAESNLAAANGALGTLITERIRNEQLWKQVQSANAINLPQLLTNTVIDGLRARRNALTTEFQEKSETFKPGYPAMVQITNKIAEVDRQLAQELKTLQSAYRAAYDGSLKQEAEMKVQIELLKSEVLDLQKRSIQYNILKREVDSTRSIYNGLLHRYKEVDVAGGVGANNVFIVDRAEVPGAPSAPLVMRTILVSLMFGTVFGLGAAFFLERVDDTIRSVEDLQRMAGMSSLGIIPRVPPETTIAEELDDLRSGLSEAYRSLCTALQFSTESGLPRSLLITSAMPEEGKSSSAIAASRQFAAMGLKVLLVDGDLRKPSLHTRLAMDNARGFSNYLTGAATPPEVIQWTAYPNLAFMPSGPLPPNAADIIGGARLHSLLSVGQQVFDIIIIDGPPVMGLADAPIMANATTATAFVVSAGQSRGRHVRTALNRLGLARATVIGSVLTKYDARAAGYGYGLGDYGYGYGYGYGQRYGLSARGEGMMSPQAAGAPILPTSAENGPR